jgi:polyisoprenoid-binding protein YceI
MSLSTSTNVQSGKMLSRLAAGLCLGAVMLLGSTQAALAQVDTAKSTISAISKQMNVPVTGTFKKFSADIQFDPAKPAAGHAQFSVDVGSYDLGAEDYNEQVRGADWFDAAHFPNATFASTAIAPAGAGTYSISGKLTIKGKSMDVVVPVTFKQQGKTQIFDGVLPVKRLQFGIGQGDWKDTSVVADEVQIKFHIVNNAK